MVRLDHLSLSVHNWQKIARLARQPSRFRRAMREDADLMIFLDESEATV